MRACYETSCSYSAWTSGVTVYYGAPLVAPSVPPTFSVPLSKYIGNEYTVSWGASTGTVTAYELNMAYDQNFVGAQPAYSGTGRSVTQVGEEVISIWYRVRACNLTACSAYTAAKKISIKEPLEPTGNQ